MILADRGKPPPIGQSVLTTRPATITSGSVLVSAWINPTGIIFRPTGRRTPSTFAFRSAEIWETTLDRVAPLTFYSARLGLFVQIDRHGTTPTDFGTVPRIAEWIVSRDFAPRSFDCHDRMCAEHTIFMGASADGQYRESGISSDDCHDLLLEMMLAERPDSPRTCRVAGACVKRWGPRWI